MRTNHVARLLIALAVVAGATALVAASAREPEPPAKGGAGALSPALEPGDSDEGPADADAAKLAQLAYPAADIPLAQLNAARAAFGKIEKKGFPKGKGKPGTWVSVGPNQAEYPLSEFRDLSSYVPNRYLAGSRINALAIGPNCHAGHCRMWIGPAGGGVWRTKNALAGNTKWQYVSGSFEINSIGSITVDPTDSTGNTIWVGTGEGNTCGSGCVHGVGIYKSTDGGDTWTGPYGRSVFSGRGVSSIAVDPTNASVVYASSTFSLHGMTSTCCSGITRIVVPGAKMWGLYKSIDGGTTWTYIHGGSANAADCENADPNAAAANNGTSPCTPRGVRQVVLDPTNHNILYSSSYGRGVWRSNDAGATWTQIKPSLNATIGTTLPWIAVNTLPNGKTRMYVGEGHTGARVPPPDGPVEYSRVFRSDDVATGTPTWTDLTSNDITDPRWGTYNFCGGQCWYDNFVYTPQGHPDIVYVGGSYGYGESIANHRGVLLSTDAGDTWTDMTADATDPVHPNALHPDQHGLVTNPQNPYQFFEGNDGGMMRSSGEFADVSSWCDSRGFADIEDGPTAAQQLARCKQMLSRVPTLLTGMNHGLTTLQFQSLSVSPFDSNELQGGTQDNGTWENYGSPEKWINTMIGDGGQSGFDVADPHFRFHNFNAVSPEVNFSAGAIADWTRARGGLDQSEASEFYIPMISDPTVSKTLWLGTQHVWRTKTAAMGSMTLAEFRTHCNRWTGDFSVQCGDWQALGDSSAAGRLTCSSAAEATPTCPYGSDRAGGNVVAVERAPGDTSTLWAATTTGRVFISKNADADPATSVTFTRLDTLAANDPNRFVSSIYVDPANANHAWISYTGFSAATPTTPGHVFDVTYNAVAGTATWVSLDGTLGDLPINDLVRDDVTGDLYAATDSGVLSLASGSSSWLLAGPGMPNIEVAGLTIVAADRKLYAATHAMGAWRFNLP